MNTPDFRDRLQATLGSAYTLERELGGGGMSRVFVAVETALGRKVVVKVLPHDLAATVNVDRFRREIQLAARLQHPHIVPLLTTGISDGLPYYTMPLVTGESLRARLARTGELPIADAVRILRDVLSALSYAHDEGVVHRDIKPDNVLLSRHTAVVTDFGVAKALNAATDAHGSLTSIGLTIGTPAYMAPEQAAADPSVDHRADIYSVGVMAYEMLTGMTLFGDRSPQRMLAAHAVEIPERVEKHRPTIPPLLASLVMTALEKRPADRPQSADEMLGVLDSIGTPSSISGAGRIAEVSQTFVSDEGRVSTSGHSTSPTGHGSKRWSRKSVAAALAAVSVVILAGLAITMGKRGDFSGKKGDANLVVVVPFRVAGAEQSLSYLREGMLDLLAAKLTGEGGPRAADPRSVLSAWRRVARSDGEDLSEAETVRLAATLGAGQVILGGIVGTPSRIVVNATVLEVPSGKAIRQEVTVQGPADSLASLVDQLAVKLLSLQAGENQQHLAELASASLPAIRAYLEGKAAYRQARYAASVDYFQRALAVDSTFALAAIGLFKAAKWVGSPLEGHAIRMTWENRDKLSGADRMFAAALSGPDYPVFPTARHSLSALDSATKLGPDQPDLWFEFGDIMFHNGRSIGVEDAFA
nr:serine/threonine protein kinase [Gemmatimonadota bacterium]